MRAKIDGGIGMNARCWFDSQGFGTWACRVCGRQVNQDPMGYTYSCEVGE